MHISNWVEIQFGLAFVSPAEKKTLKAGNNRLTKNFPTFFLLRSCRFQLGDLNLVRNEAGNCDFLLEMPFPFSPGACVFKQKFSGETSITTSKRSFRSCMQLFCLREEKTALRFIAWYEKLFFKATRSFVIRVLH